MGGLTVADGERQAPYGMSPVDKYRLSAAGLADQFDRLGVTRASRLPCKVSAPGLLAGRR